ncbi:hypothetical protein [Bartonella sp. DGB2]|uniref:hypothetical protein n=1 Tax=Bartonella sp. DGB2 TaxID=3388426 RepID=UPI00398FCDE9
MRVLPIMLILVSIIGFLYPGVLLDADAGGGRWVFIATFALALSILWRMGRWT